MIDEDSEFFKKPDTRKFEDSALNFTLGGYDFRIVSFLEAEFRWVDGVVILLTMVAFAFSLITGIPICIVGTLVLGFIIFMIVHHTYISEAEPPRTVGEAIKDWKSHINEKNQVFEQCFSCNEYGFFKVDYSPDIISYKCPNCREEYHVRD